MGQHGDNNEWKIEMGQNECKGILKLDMGQHGEMKCDLENNDIKTLSMGQGRGFEPKQCTMGQGHPGPNLKQILIDELQNHKPDDIQHDVETIKTLVSNPNIPITNMFMECNQVDPMVVEVNALTTDDLTTIGKEVGFLKLPEYKQLEEKYLNRLFTLNNLKISGKIAAKHYDAEELKDENERDQGIIDLYTTINSDITNFENEVEEIEKELKAMTSKDSPFEVSELKLPNTYGTEDTPSFKKLLCVPNVDTNNSITDVWNFLVEIGSDLGLSKKGYERALWLKLDGEMRDTWQKYRKLDLKEAVDSLVKTFDNPLKSYHIKEKIALFRCKDTESAVNSIYRLLNMVDKAFGNSLDPNNENNLQVLRLRTLDEKLSKICKSNEMYKAVHKKLDLIRQSNKNPGISDYIQICQMEEESHERSQMAKLSMEVNQLELQNTNGKVNDQNGIELNYAEWGNRSDQAPHQNCNEYQSEDVSYDRNYHPWDDEGCEAYGESNECYDEDPYDGGYGSKPRYHKVSQSVGFQDDQHGTSTNGSLCQSCNGAGYITTGGNECNELQILADCTEQISVPFHEDNDEDQE